MKSLCKMCQSIQKSQRAQGTDTDRRDRTHHPAAFTGDSNKFMTLRVKIGLALLLTIAISLGVKGLTHAVARSVCRNFGDVTIHVA